MFRSFRIVQLRVATLIIAIFLLTSCEDYLDVNPASEVKEDELFEDEQGYKDALYGVYQMISDKTLYGDNLTMGFVDVLAQQYNTRSSSHMFYDAGLYRYEDSEVEARIFDIWSSMYTAIAQINFILENIDANRNVFSSDQLYSTVKGEALSLRAFLHFDLVRLFGSAPITSSGAAAIPYRDEFSVKNEDRLSVKEILKKCEADFKEAEALLAPYPEMDEIRNPKGSLGGTDNFLAFRQNRMNLWAVKGLLARLYLYKGDQSQAFLYANEVIDSGYFRFMTQTELNTTGEFNDRTFSYEHVFSLSVYDLRETSDEYFRFSTGESGSTDTKLLVEEDKVKNVYEVSQGYSSDPRYDKLWQFSQSIFVHAKFWQEDELSPLLKNLVPVVRLSEMYYIAAESTQNPGTAVKYINEVRQARFIPALPDDLSAEVLQNEIFKEYRKEFYSEGQLFYYYKRTDAENIIDSQISPVTDEEYVLPIPLREVEFGG
ncbi:SusD-like starch-binding protein associating with outer membrane [Leeuwenhoekiella polynyae]|uniref:SusD-like starch-binding protein associating with outer membrane n=2 Tax=Leeuwenhoekiella polynyae TaxID=1550906 RepID=A0A4Q0P815_9FLAO|nr:SusD-like starch-binding protein associating with outer membrane [Leeuwenhoekiella polynyae]